MMNWICSLIKFLVNKNLKLDGISCRHLSKSCDEILNFMRCIMKNRLALLTLLLSITANADELTTNEQYIKIIKSAKDYANSISCPGIEISKESVILLNPQKAEKYYNDALYAVLWDGDIGCRGGSATENTNISLIAPSVGDTFVVLPSISSPAIKFNIPVRYVSEIVSHTNNTLTLTGMKYGPHDPNSAPSIPDLFTVKIDKNGNWNLIW